MSDTEAKTRLIAVSRVCNEDDILEAFVRHHATLFDHHVLLDQGATNRSLDILRALHAEGLPFTVVQNRTAHFCEPSLLTGLFGVAAGMGADWVLFLDCDEFLDERGAEGGLRARLGAIEAETPCLRLPVARYHPTGGDDPAEPVVPRRLRHRESARQPDCKVCVRGPLAGRGITIDAGGHAAIHAGQRIAAPPPMDLPLARFRRRSPAQDAARAAIARLRAIAAGQNATDHRGTTEDNTTFEALRDDPASVLRNPGFFGAALAAGGLVEDPIAYAGGDLRHTVPSDPAMQAVAAVAAYAESLAGQHGRLMDTNEGVRAQAHNATLIWTRLF